MQVNVNSIVAHADWMANNSNNIANIDTQGYKASDTVLQNDGAGISASSSKSESRTNLTKEITDQISISKGIEANVAVIKTENKILGSLLDILI